MESKFENAWDNEFDAWIPDKSSSIHLQRANALLGLFVDVAFLVIALPIIILFFTILKVYDYFVTLWWLMRHLFRIGGTKNEFE